MKYFIFGNGKWSQNHQRILNGQCVPFLVFDIEMSPDQAIQFHGLPLAVIVTASTVNHHSLTAFFLERSIPVFCEKPICLEHWQIDHLRSLITKNPIFMAGHQLVFDDIVEQCSKDENVVFFSSKRTGAIPRCEGAIMSLAVHDIAIAMHLFNYDAPVSITASGTQHAAQINIKWRSGCQADIYVQSIAQVQLRHAVIVNSRGEVTYIDPGCWNRTNLLEKELMHFIHCVATGRQPTRNNLKQALAVMDVTIKARDLINKQTF